MNPLRRFTTMISFNRKVIISNRENLDNKAIKQIKYRSTLSTPRLASHNAVASRFREATFTLATCFARQLLRRCNFCCGMAFSNSFKCEYLNVLMHVIPVYNYT